MSDAKSNTDDRYTVGITLWTQPEGEYQFFSNGLRQNVIHLYRMFAASPRCKKVYLINYNPNQNTTMPAELGVPQSAIVGPEKVVKKLDYLIACGSSPDIETTTKMRANGTKVIAYKGGNAAVISIEAVVARAPDKDGERYYDAPFIDAVWITPQHMHTYKSWAELVYRCPVHQVPQIWDDTFFKMQPEPLRASFGYKPGERPWRIGVLEPNITVMKTSHLPALVCEEAYRQKPDAFKAFYLTNAIQFKEDNHFATFISSLSSCKAGLMTVEPRFVTWEFLANHADAVVTHHWENGLNYLYYDVLYGNYPLIHNSEFLKGWGYYYQDFDSADGARALLEAVSTHDKRLDAYRENNALLFERLRPTSRENIHLHETLLLNTTRKTSF
jgi:hypothetical protein